MQLHLRRSQRDGGVISKNVIFCLDAQAAFTPQEDENIRRYKLHNQCIYNSEASKQWLERAQTAGSAGTVGGSMRSLAFSVMHRLKLNITVNSLARGHHIECKSLDELLGAEDSLYEACRNLRSYLDTAATFDGREVVVAFDSEEPKIVAHAQPQQQLVATPVPVAVAPAQAAIAAPASTIEAVIPDAQPAPEYASYEPAPLETSAYAPSYGEVSMGTPSFFSDGAQGDKEKMILKVVGGVMAFFIFIAIVT